jgi:hypothetical protein
MWSDVSPFTVFPTSSRFMFGKRPRKPTILNACFQLWNIEADLWWFGQQYLAILLTIITLRGRITGSDYVGISGNHVHLIVQMHRNNEEFFSIWQFSHTHSQKCSVLVWGALRRTATSSLTSTIARLQYKRTAVVSFREYVEKHSISSSINFHATRICSSWRGVQYCTRDNSELTRVYTKKDTSCITGKWWHNSLLIKECVPFSTASIILSITSK